MASDEETLEDLEMTILSMCQDSDGDQTVINAEKSKREEKFQNFHISPSKLEGIQLPVYPDKESILKVLKTPLTILSISPIKFSDITTCSTPAQCTPRGFESQTPNTLELKQHVHNLQHIFCSTPTMPNPKKLLLNEFEYTEDYVTVSETGGESFEELLKSVSIICEPAPSNTNNISTIDMKTIFDATGRNNEPLADITLEDITLCNPDIVADGDFFKNRNENVDSPRFKADFNYSRSTTVHHDFDEDVDLTEDILGLDYYILLDEASSYEDSGHTRLDSTLVEDRKSEVESDATNLAAAIIPGPEKMDGLMNDQIDDKERKEVGASKSTLKRKHEENESDNGQSEAGDDFEAKRMKAVEKTTDERENLAKEYVLILDTISDVDSRSSNTDDVDNTIQLAKQTATDIKPRIDKKPALKNVATVTPMVHEVRILSTPPSKDGGDSDSVIEVIMVEESIVVVDLTDDTIISEPSAPSPTPITKNVPILKETSLAVPDSSSSSNTSSSIEKRLMEQIKSKWGQESFHNIDNNLTMTSYMRKRTDSCSKSVLEGNSRFPPLFRNVTNQNEITHRNQGRTVTDIAAGIKKQLANIDSDCNKKIKRLETSMNSRVNNLKNSHWNQIQMLTQKQFNELHNVLSFIRTNPTNPMGQCENLQLHEDHLNQRQALKYRHNEAFRNLIGSLLAEKNGVWQDAAQAKSNLQFMVNKLNATQNKNTVDPDQVHATVDLIKGPCRSNGQQQSLVQVCLPADIASCMIREDEVYSMYYKYK